MNRIIFYLIIVLLCSCKTVEKSVIEKTIIESKRELIVSLYPYIPNADKFYNKVEREFESEFDDIDLKIKLNTWKYYDDIDGKGIIEEEADVYEIDAILLNDFISKGKIQPLSTLLNFDESLFLPASNVAKIGDDWYGKPHWVCGNFQFSRTSDSEINSSSSFSEIEKIISQDISLKNSLFIDLKGTSTLGEHYFDSLMDEVKDYKKAKKYLSEYNIAPKIIDNINRAVRLCYNDYCRNDNYHDNTGFYSRQFARKKGRVLVGYSESLYYLIDENIRSCSKEDNCTNQEDLTVKEWYFSDNGNHLFNWVDVLSVSSKLKGQELDDAIKFINFFTSEKIYNLALIPEWGEAPRYLLPAERNYFVNKQILDKAPLYKDFYKIIQKSDSFTEDKLSPTLRRVSRKVDSLIIDK